MEHLIASRTPSGARRWFAHAVLALHLFVFALGGVFAAPAPQVSLQRALAVTVLGDGGSAAVASTDRRLDRATRARAPRRERGHGVSDHVFVLTSSVVRLASAIEGTALPRFSQAHTFRATPSLVHGPRGPPQA